MPIELKFKKNMCLSDDYQFKSSNALISFTNSSFMEIVFYLIQIVSDYERDAASDTLTMLFVLHGQTFLWEA